jgi:1-phosphofructokinase family hexose kinase
VPDFRAGIIYRPSQVIVAAGGKGINVARAVKKLNGDPVCAGFLGGHAGRLIADLATAEGLRSGWTWIQPETRTCVIITNPNNGEATVLNENGPTISHEDWQHLADDILRESADAECVCFSGSLPPGVSPDDYVQFVHGLRQAGKSVWVDTSGAPLKAALNAGNMNIKVNGDEAGAIIGKTIHSVANALQAASEIQATGLETVVLTLGGKGAVLAHAGGVWYSQPPPVKVQNNVGSGDSFLAGLVCALTNGLPPSEALRHAVAAGTANAAALGGGHFTFDDFSKVLKETPLQAG